MMDDEMDKGMEDIGMELTRAKITFQMVPLMVVIQYAAYEFRYSDTGANDNEISDFATNTS